MKNIFFFFLAILAFSGCKKKSITSNCCAEPPFYQTLPGGVIHVPNVFTPDGDGKNDYFGPIITPPEAYISYTIKITNAKGKTLFETTDANLSEPWDGTVDGKRVRDILGWKIIVKAFNAESFEYQGQICSIVEADGICPKLLDQCYFSTQYDASIPGFDLDKSSQEMLCIE